MKNSHTVGLISAPLTPFHPDGSINPDAIAQYADMLSRNKVIGVFVNGSTGEGLSLTTEERKIMAEKWVEVAPDNLKIIIHIGHNSSETVKDLAKHAQDIGADAVGTLPPTYFRPANAKELAENLAPLAAAAPKIPFYYYHIPSLSMVNFSMFEFLKEASQLIPNFGGIKYTFENLKDYNQCLRYQNYKYDILFGRDEMFLPAIAMGSQAAVGSTYNFIPALYNQIQELMGQNKVQEARILQEKAIDIIQVLIETPDFMAALKEIMKFLGLDCGPVRNPKRNLTPDQITNLKQRLDQTAFSEFCLN